MTDVHVHVHVRQAGRTVAARVLTRVRVVAVVVLALLGLGYVPDDATGPSRPVALVLIAAAAVLLLVTDRLVARAAGPSRRAALLGALADTVVVLGVVHVAGPPPASLAVVLLLLPLLESVLLAGVAGLAVSWVGCSTLVAVLQFVGETGIDPTALHALVVAMPVLLLTALPLGLLTEHLVAEVTRSAAAESDAADRARLLAELVGATVDLASPDVQTSVDGLVAGAVRLGAEAAQVTAPDGRVLAGAGAGAGADDATGTPRTWQLGEDGAGPVLVVRLDEDRTGADRLLETLELLVAQARVAYAHAVVVTRLHEHSAELGEQAARDPLTGLLNRRGLLAVGDTPGLDAGVLFCDLDGFKAVNDRLGHAAGDVLLQRVATRLDLLRPAGSVLARIGGDEFALLVPGTTADELAELARRVEVEVGRPVLLTQGMARVGVSVGSARTGSDVAGIPALLAVADTAMYATKRTRRAGDRDTVTTVAPGAVLVGA